MAGIDSVLHTRAQGGCRRRKPSWRLPLVSCKNRPLTQAKTVSVAAYTASHQGVLVPDSDEACWRYGTWEAACPSSWPGRAGCLPGWPGAGAAASPAPTAAACKDKGCQGTDCLDTDNWKHETALVPERLPFPLRPPAPFPPPCHPLVTRAGRRRVVRLALGEGGCMRRGPPAGAAPSGAREKAQRSRRHHRV